MRHDPENDKRPLEHPPLELLSERAIREAAEKHDELLAKLNATANHRYELEQSRHEAVEQDRDAYATAIVEGKKDPGQVATRERDTEITETARREEALKVAVARARQVELDALERGASKLRAHAQKVAEEERRAILDALEKVADHHRRLADALGLEAWTTKATAEGYARWSPAGFAAQVRGLTAPSGDPFSVEQVLAALRELAGPEPAPSADQRTWPTAA